jgi:acetylornithine aminotransferase
MNPDIMARADAAIAATYKRFPIALVKGEDCTLTDAAGRTYTDFLAGIAVCNLGHCHPRVTAAVAEQAGTLVHVSNLYYTLPQTELAGWLTAHSFADRVFFCNSGAEANEAAIKLARRFFYEKGEERYRIIAAEGSFHGRTMATLSATGQDKIRKGFHPVLPGFDFVPFDDADELRDAIGPDTCAVLLEPIQGEGGVRVPSGDYLQAVRHICDEAGILLIFDEIQTGIGRTGKLFAHEHFGIEPDIMTLAKALANGLPMGAMLAKEWAVSAFGPGAHASTFGGTPLVSAAAMATLNVLDGEGLIEGCRKKGAYFKEQLQWLKDRHETVVDVRGMGLLLGMELETEGETVVTAAMAEGFLINCIQEKVLRFAPPLTIRQEQIDNLIACLDKILP